MDFSATVVVLLTYFIRPQDWIPGMSGVNIVKPLMAVALLTMFTRRRGFTLGSLLRTPHDWMMLAYGAYIVLTAPEGTEVMAGVLSLMAFYYVTSQSLSTGRRLARFLGFWLLAIVVVAVMALLAEYGLDLTGAFDISHAIPDNPRLILNTYLFNNPNALGHTMILAIPLAYFTLIWRRSMAKWLFGAAVLFVVGYCAYLTRSKGAYIVGLVLIVCSQIVGRRLIVQIVFLVLGVTLGIGLLARLPRMEQLHNVRQDEAILGRVMAWEVARTATREFPTGYGWKEFEARILFDGQELSKATHSAYVKIAGDLGEYGLFLFLALIYSGFRTLLFARCRSEDDERSRRILFTLLLGYALSGWMIDRAYHLEYFLMLGAISALHRRLGVESGLLEDVDSIREDAIAEGDLEEAGEDSDSEAVVGPVRLARSAEETIGALEDVDTSEVVEEIVEEEIARVFYWRRFGFLDLLLSVGILWLVLYVWDYVLLNL